LTLILAPPVEMSLTVQEIIASDPSTIVAGWQVGNRLACRRLSLTVLRAMKATLGQMDKKLGIKHLLTAVSSTSQEVSSAVLRSA
jgi:hypothetical protein